MTLDTCQVRGYVLSEGRGQQRVACVQPGQDGQGANLLGVHHRHPRDRSAGGSSSRGVSQCSVACLVSAGLMDEHWMPIHELCSVCAVEMDYDFVVKFEQLAAEERYLLNRLVHAN